ncbi:MAG: diadenylate cyclase [Pirellulaceae bacterium]
MSRLQSNVFDQIRAADFLDIAITATLLYVLFVWLRDRASRSLAIVTAALVLLFGLARWLDLYLTTFVFHYGSLGIFLAILVVFQNDIRHGIERLTSVHWFRGTSDEEPLRRMATAVAAAVAEMANQRVGALIVFPGRQSIERHLHGGIPVDAIISQPLLLSIFHPKSPGHDGAILIDLERISKLGLHLPLSSRVNKVHDAGTRHAAALGLAECSDALTVVVSEERGTITLAQYGELKVIDPAVLADQIYDFVDGQGRAKDMSTTRRLAGWGAKAGAVLTAGALWFTFAYHTDTVQRTYVVPIEYRNVPNDVVIESPKPEYVEVTLSGVEPAFTTLNTTAVAVAVDIERFEGRTFIAVPVASHLINVSADLRIENVNPEHVVVSMQWKPDREREAKP